MTIEHVAVWVRNLDLMREFYVTYFGGVANEKYRNEKKNYESYFIAFYSGARLELMQMPGITDTTNSGHEQFMGLTHLAFSVGSKAKVDEMTELFRKAGFEVVGEPRWTGDGYYESVILDPEKNRIEITA
ncbi:VOC family protein [Emticicia sp. 21SJ11W-3]|uniref:VOC family protein n=1 Tax=Emticicia sp. 21SJ11W-3 TaxID=2916755 RepID=UPI00209CF9CA|nr:VOC family protein [Emticicia sp. 21SJ11W-3]UTA67773.1 VOC family protein [Emticicia sp. 21SJ11W-3]